MLNNKTIIITGGTGSFGKKFISTILKKYKKIKKIIIFSRDELKQFEMMKDYEKTKHHKILRFFIGSLVEDGSEEPLDPSKIVQNRAK